MAFLNKLGLAMALLAIYVELAVGKQLSIAENWLVAAAVTVGLLLFLLKFDEGDFTCGF